MANTFTSLLPTIIKEASVEYLAKRNSLINRIFTVGLPQTRLGGGNAVVIQKPATMFTPTDVDYTQSVAAQNITIPSTTVTVDQHKEVKISVNDLEDVISQGGMPLIISQTVPGIVDGLLSQVDAKVAALYASFTQTTGTYSTDVTDANLRDAVQQLQAANVDLNMQNVSFVTTSKGYTKDLLGIDRYTTPLNIGGQGEPLRTGRMVPTLFNMGVDYSPNIVTGTISGTAVAHSLVFEKYAFVAAFEKFRPTSELGSNAPLEEYIVTDPRTGVSLRFQKYFEPGRRTWFLQVDVNYGVALLDASRFVRYIHKNS